MNWMDIIIYIGFFGTGFFLSSWLGAGYANHCRMEGFKDGYATGYFEHRRKSTQQILEEAEKSPNNVFKLIKDEDETQE